MMCPKLRSTISFIHENRFNPFDSAVRTIGNSAFRNFVTSEKDDLAKLRAE